MEQYNILKHNFNDRLLFKLSQIGYALHSTLLCTNRINELSVNELLLDNLKHGQSIFISVWKSDNNLNFEMLINILQKNNIKLNFYLMDEPFVDTNIITKLLPYSINIFCNNNILDHPQIHCFPIGIRDCENVFYGHKGFSHSYLFNEKNNIIDKNILCLLCFTLSTSKEREICYSELKDKNFVININDDYYETNNNPEFCGKVPISINYTFLHKSYYALCPKGAGEDTHRFWEAIYLNTIPIVKRTGTAFDKLFNVFPCLIIDKWEQITKDFLEDNLKNCTEKMELFHKNYPNAFTDLDSIQELLLQT
jgi:hypothetical protein